MKEYNSINEKLGFPKTSNSGETIHVSQHLVKKKISGEKTELQINDSNENSLGLDGFHRLPGPPSTDLDITSYRPKSNSESLKDWRFHHITMQSMAASSSLLPLSQFFFKKPVCPFAVHLQDEFFLLLLLLSKLMIKVPLFAHKFKRKEGCQMCSYLFHFPCYHITVIYTNRQFTALILLFVNLSPLKNHSKSSPKPLIFSSLSPPSHAQSFLWKAVH